MQKGDVYIFTSTSRLGRSTGDNIFIMNQIHKSNCKLVILDLQIDTTHYMGQAMFEITSTISQIERNLISQRTKDVMQFMKQNGTLRTKPPFGFQISEIDGKKQTIKHPQEQVVINFIKQLVVNKPNIRLCEIMKSLVANNMTLRNGKLYHQGIKLILIREGLKLQN